MAFADGLDSDRHEFAAGAKGGKQEGGIKQDDDFRGLGAQLQSHLTRASTLEAAQSSLFKSGWRLAVGRLCVARLAYELLLRPLLPKALIVVGMQGVPPLSLDDFPFEPVPGLFGLGTLRSLDSWRRVSAIALR